ncbi:MAG: LIM domain-containing protein [Candidatus Izemoplasmatales bacterium]
MSETTTTTCGAGPVQYEGAIAGSKKAEFPKCEACGKELESGSYWRDGKPYCSDCFTMMLAEHNPEKDLPNSDYDLPFQYEPDEPMTFQQAAVRVAAEWAILLTEKQMDYGPNNILGFGEQGLLVREWDKINRLKNLLHDNPHESNNESVDDTWRDIGGYAMIAVMLKRGWFTLPVKEATK